MGVPKLTRLTVFGKMWTVNMGLFIMHVNTVNNTKCHWPPFKVSTLFENLFYQKYFESLTLPHTLSIKSPATSVYDN